ncbi:MAG: prepilin peptidase [Anaerolineales bacterium]|nr:MAG: prepilin peptidase [Anaerolineales bacterium]
MNIVLPLFYTLLGISIGSFINVLIDRLPEGKSILSSPSHCDACKRRLSSLELIPIASFIFLRGRCRTCQAKISPRSLWVEVITGLLFLLTWFRFGQSWETVLYTLYVCLLIIIAGIDLEHQKILNYLIYPAIGIALIMIPVLHREEAWMTLLGGLVGFGVLFLIALIAPGAMGMGDVKLILFLGFIIGFPEIVITLFLAFVVGGLVAGVLLAQKKIGKKDSIAFGPYLAFAGVITLLVGTQILEWYLRRVGG